MTVSGAAVLTHNEGIEACGIGKPSGIPRHAKKKTGAASGGKSYLSGWSAKKPKSFEKMDIADVPQVRTNMGMPQASHSWDNGVVGRYNNSHVEKQAIVDNGGTAPISVDRDMCGDCQEFASWYSYRNDVDITISDPSGIRIFRRTGDVEFLGHWSTVIRRAPSVDFFRGRPFVLACLGQFRSSEDMWGFADA